MSASLLNVPGLIADIGGTNARFALADRAGVYEERVLKCHDYPDLASAAVAYLALVKPEHAPRTASFAIAGPVIGDRFEMTNHIWNFSIEETRKTLGLERFRLMNDFAALALAVPYLQGAEKRKLNDATATVHAPIGIIGPGTGLGVASLFWNGRHYQAVPGEGGHVTMPARTLREFDIFAELIRQKYHHISAERVCSGKGLVNLYNALRALEGRTELPERTPEEISQAAISGSCAVCKEALDLMLTFLGRVAGNLALTLGTFGGIYIAGGIISQLGDYFERSGFLTEFFEKGRFRDYLGHMPVFVIQHAFPAFVGLRADLINHA